MNFRYASWVISIGLFALAWSNRTLIADQSVLNALSYWGTAATMVALLLAIGELIHSIQTTQSIQSRVISIVEDFKRIDDASMISECLAGLDAVISKVSDERYDDALAEFRFFRRVVSRTEVNCNLPNDTNISLNFLGRIENKILSATRSSLNAEATFSVPQKNILVKELLQLKQLVVTHKPSNGVSNVAAKNS